MAGETTFTATEADYVAANRLWHSASARQRWLLWLGLAGSLLAVSNVIFRIASGDHLQTALADSLPILMFSAIILGIRILTPIMLPRQVRKMMIQNNALSEPVRVSWDDEALNMIASNGTAYLRWNRLHRLLDDERNFVFLQTDRLMFIIPIRALDVHQIEDLRTTMRIAGLLKH